MTSPVVVMVTVASRVAMLENFLASLAKYEPGLPIAIHVQHDQPSHGSYLGSLDTSGVEVAHFMESPRPMGCHASRVLLQRELAGQGFDTYVNVDDDVELIEQTNWAPAMAKALEPGVGFVLTNWVRHPNLLAKRIPAMEDRFYKQVMVYNGGGMAYGEAVADLMRGLPPVAARYDDIWPLTAYLQGYQSYRYQGSLAVHRIMSKGGMNAYMRREPQPLLCWDWVNYRPLYGQPVGSDYSIPSDSDLRERAKAVHREARERRTAEGWS